MLHRPIDLEAVCITEITTNLKKKSGKRPPIRSQRPPKYARLGRIYICKRLHVKDCVRGHGRPPTMRPDKSMGSQTMTTPISEIGSQSPNSIHFVPSSSSIPPSAPASSSYSFPSTSPMRNLLRRTKQEQQHTSFDLTPIAPAWYVERRTGKARIRNWLDRQYYQYEVTWGLYVLTPTEKIIINTLVLSFFSLILYGFAKLTVFHYVVDVICQCATILARNGRVILQELSELLMDRSISSSSSVLAHGGREDYVISTAQV